MKNESKQRLRYIVSGLFSGFIGAALFLAAIMAFNQQFVPIQTPNTGGLAASSQTTNFVPATSEEGDIISVVKKAQPAVLSIIVSKQVAVGVPNTGSDNGYFGFPFNFSIPNFTPNGGSTVNQEVGSGSAFLISGDGLAITNKHVVQDKNAELTAVTDDGKHYQVSVIAKDPMLDIAVIKIKNAPANMPYLSLGSGSPEVGSTAIAIGNALGEFQNTVSVGVVSGLSRSLVASDPFGGVENLDQVIQTDAAINPGNSGGPLLNSKGQVIGVNVALAEGGQSVGFAIPASAVLSIIESVQKFGRIVRPYLGVRYVSITPEVQTAEKLPVDYGVLVQGGSSANEPAVIPGSPAAKAGIVENDIILDVDGKKLDNSQSLANIIGEKKVGDSVTLKILHNTTEKDISVKLEELST